LWKWAIVNFVRAQDGRRTSRDSLLEIIATGHTATVKGAKKVAALDTPRVETGAPKLGQATVTSER